MKVLNCLSTLIVNKVNVCVLRKICESLNKFSKFYWKFWVFKKILIKISENLKKLKISFTIDSHFWLRRGLFSIICKFSGGGGGGAERGKLPLFLPPPATPLVLININFLYGSILCLILLIETKFDYIFLKFLLKLVYSFKFSSCQIWTMCAQVKSFLTLRLWPYGILKAHQNAEKSPIYSCRLDWAATNKSTDRSLKIPINMNRISTNVELAK